MRVTSWEPLVSVPVLSNTIVVIFREDSKAVLLRINNPFLADILVDIAATNGTARPKACGQEITITVTIRSIANAIVSPNANHVKKVPKPNTRSEEHTSELQSRPHLVCRLLLEKKKNTN